MRSKQGQRRNTISRRKHRPMTQTPGYSRSSLKVPLMSVGPLPKITFQTAAEVCRRYEPDEEAMSSLQEGIGPTPFLDALAERGLWSEAIKFLSQALPKRDAITWASQCVRDGSKSDLPPRSVAALDAVDAWLKDSTDDHRRAAQAAAEQAGAGTPAGCVAFGVFFSGGSLGPKTLEHAIPPADELTGKALAGALMLAAVASEPENAPVRLQAFVEQGLQMARSQD